MRRSRLSPGTGRSFPRSNYRPALETLEDRLSPAVLPPGFVETPVAAGLTFPTAMEFAPDGQLFVAEQGGTLRVVKNGALLPAPFVSLDVDSSGERGLLGIAFDPGFAVNHFVYVYYTAKTPAVHNRVSRFVANGDVALPGSEAVILELNNLSTATNHNGGAIHFGPDGKLFVATGENANPNNAQSLNNLLGKILRINPDGTVPADNPFFAVTTGSNRAIWALGLRNPFTFTFQPGTGRMFINDVGQNTFEEINDGIAGSNYGWPFAEGPTTDPRFRNPIFFYGHGISPTTGCAITGGAFYNPAIIQFPSDYLGDYFFADFCSGWIRKLDPAQGNTVSDFALGIAAPVDLKVSADGALFYLARAGAPGAGAVFRVDFPSVPPQVRLTSSTYTVGEAGGFATVTVVRAGDVSGPLAVDFATSDGTAQAGSDYTAAAGTLTFAAFESSKTFTVPVLNDAAMEPGESINLTLSNPTAGTTLASPAMATLTIVDNDGPASAGERFVAQAYLDLFGREVDAGGLSFWTGLLTQGFSRGQVASFLTSSPEYQTARVKELYLLLLGREADPGGLNFFVNALQRGGTLDQVRAALFGSDEYFAGHGGGSRDGFLRALFFDLFGRPIDPPAIVPLDQFLAIGGSRTTLAAILLGSLEAKQRLVQTAYRLFLRRDADAGGFSAWPAALRQGLREETFIAALLGANEYSARL